MLFTGDSLPNRTANVIAFMGWYMALTECVIKSGGCFCLFPEDLVRFRDNVLLSFRYIAHINFRKTSNVPPIANIKAFFFKARDIFF